MHASQQFERNLPHPTSDDLQQGLHCQFTTREAEMEGICYRCSADKLIMVGDRYLTDIVYGNRNGLLTIRPAPLTMKGDPSVVRMVTSLPLS